MVRTDREIAQLQKAILGQQVEVQQQLLVLGIGFQAAIGGARAAEVARVLGTGFGALVVQPGAPDRRQGQIGLADTAADLLEQLPPLIIVCGKPLLGMPVFRVQVLDHFVAVALLHPGVGIGRGITAS